MRNMPRGDCQRPCFDQLNPHILEYQQNSKRFKMCAFSWSKNCRLQSPLGKDIIWFLHQDFIKLLAFDAVCGIIKKFLKVFTVWSKNSKRIPELSFGTSRRRVGQFGLKMYPKKKPHYVESQGIHSSGIKFMEWFQCISLWASVFISFNRSRFLRCCILKKNDVF